MSEAVIKADLREKGTKSQLKQLRKAGKIPAVFYSAHKDSRLITLDAKEFRHLLLAGANIFDLVVGKGRKKACIVREVQVDPVTDEIVHVDLLGIKASEKVTMKVPIVLVGEAIGVKDFGGILEHQLREVEISCLPKDIPENIEIDISHLNIGDSVTIGDLKMENVEFLTDPEHTVASVSHPKKVEEEVVAEEEGVGEEEAEPEVIHGKEEKTEEGE
ncbi:MAG: 50S ribosomal protein L25 [Calditrichaeota bacterium]|nr:50S ribosomal protein L25 [Calditrichota bacterium]